jgi:hypothetical protein
MKALWYVACCEMLYMDMCIFVTEICMSIEQLHAKEEEERKLAHAWEHAFDVHHCRDCLSKCADCPH